MPIPSPKERNRAHLESLLAEVEGALVSIELAETAEDESRRAQALRDARRALHAIRLQRPHFTFSDMDAVALDVKLEVLSARLRRVMAQIGLGD
jgi:hypothetical protein